MGEYSPRGVAQQRIATLLPLARISVRAGAVDQQPRSGRWLPQAARLPLQPWYWRLNGETGRLRMPAADYVSITDVDNRDRILGRTSDKGKLLGEVRNQRAVLWRGPNSHPEVFGGLHESRQKL